MVNPVEQLHPRGGHKFNASARARLTPEAPPAAGALTRVVFGQQLHSRVFFFQQLHSRIVFCPTTTLMRDVDGSLPGFEAPSEPGFALGCL